MTKKIPYGQTVKPLHKNTMYIINLYSYLYETHYNMSGVNLPRLSSVGGYFTIFYDFVVDHLMS